MAHTLQVLLVQSWVADPRPVLDAIERGGFDPYETWERVDHEVALRAAAERGGWDIVLYDNATREILLPALLATLREHDLEIPIVVLGKLDELALEIQRALAAQAKREKRKKLER